MITTILLSRHPELVSGSIFRLAQMVLAERWMLKQVQHDVEGAVTR
jgi:hypothetical protein